MQPPSIHQQPGTNSIKILCGEDDGDHDDEDTGDSDDDHNEDVVVAIADKAVRQGGATRY